METPRRKDRRKLSRVSCQKLKSATVKENVLPSTQAFQPTCTSSSLKEGGEVYWDSNSPSLKTKILRHYSECSSPDVRKSLSPQIVSTPSARVCTQESPKIDEQDLSLLQSLKALNDFDKDTDSNTEDNEESKESNENTFNSDEDSFLVLASQIPTSETSRSQNSLGKTKTQSSLKPPSLPRLPPPAFDEDDDDEMDLLLSQIEMPKEVEEETKVLNIKSVRRHEQVTAAPAAAHIEEKFLKRRFKSSEQGPKSSSSANIMKGWRRSNTEPETSSGSALPGGRILPPAKCTQEDIEKKRQEALRRRKEKLRSY